MSDTDSELSGVIRAYHFDGDLLCGDCAMDVREGPEAWRLKMTKVVSGECECDYCHGRIE